MSKIKACLTQNRDHERLWDADAPLTAAELETALPGPPRARTTLLTLLARWRKRAASPVKSRGGATSTPSP